MLTLSILGLFLLLALLGFPLAFALGIATLAFAIVQGIPISILAQTAFSTLDQFPYIAIPLFILVGNLMDSGGLSARLVRFSSSMLLKVPGSLGSITVLSSAFFGAISGPASATTAAIGGMMIPEMQRRGYSSSYAGALAATAGTLGAIIPPSTVMIIYAVVAGVSVGDMFIAGLLPGAIITVGLILVNTVYSLIHRLDISHPDEHVSIKNIASCFWHAKWALLSPVIVLGGIYSGVFTATEAAVIAVFYSFVVGVFIHRELRPQDILGILFKTCRTTGAVLIIIPFASTLARLLTLAQVPQQIGDLVLSWTQNPHVILLIAVALIFISGMFLDATPLILIYTPLFSPILAQMGVSLIHFGVVITLGAMIGAVTPPVGMNLYVAQAIAKTDTLQIMKKSLLFIAAFMILYALITVNSWTSTLLLSVFKG